MNLNYDWDKLAKSIIKAFGGKNNINDYFHCATRLRLEIKDESKIDIQSIKKIDLSKGYYVVKPQHQIIFGAGTVNKVYSAFDKQMMSNVDRQKNKNQNIKIRKQPWWNKNLSFWSNLFMALRRMVRNFGDIFLPLIPVLIAGGIGLAMNSLLKQVAKDNAAAIQFSNIFNLIGSTIYILLPSFIGFTMMRKIGGNAYIGMAIGLILVGPSLLGSWDFAGGIFFSSEAEKKLAMQQAISSGNLSKALEVGSKPVLLTIFDNFAGGFFKIEFANYQSQVAPVMLAIGAGYWIEKFMKKIAHDAIAIILVPVLTVFLTVYLSMWIIGPIGRTINDWMALGFNSIYKYTNFPWFGLGGALIGFILMPFVITGLHQAPLMLEPGVLLQTLGEMGHSFTWFNPIWFGAHASMGFALIATIFNIKKAYRKDFSAIAVPASVTANFGITEPAIFGVALPVKYPMLGAAIGGAIAGYWAGMTQVQANSIGSASWIGVIQFDFTSNFTYGNEIWDGKMDIFAHQQKSFAAVANETRGWIEKTKSGQEVFHISYYDYTGIKSSLQSWPPVVHVSIILGLGSISGFVSTFLLGKTKWGKNSRKQYYVDKGYQDKKTLVSVKK